MAKAVFHSKVGAQLLLIRFCYSHCGILYLFNVLYALRYVHHINGEEKAGCFAYFVFLVFGDYGVALPHGAMGLSAVCDCDIS